MRRTLGFVGMTVGGWGGWWLGAHIGFFTAYMVSVIGSGVGLYAALRFTRDYLG